jgi:hypothetical protein
MGIAGSLDIAAKKLIDTFGNDASLYTYSSATTTTDDEGQITVTDWGTPASVKVIEGGNQGPAINRENQGWEQTQTDDKIVRSDVAVAVNDRLTYDGYEYRVVEVKSERVESTDIIFIITVAEATSTSTW